MIRNLPRVTSSISRSMSPSHGSFSHSSQRYLHRQRRFRTLRTIPPLYRHSSRRSIRTSNRHSTRRCFKQNMHDNKLRRRSGNGSTTHYNFRLRNFRPCNYKLPSRPSSYHRKLHLGRTTPSRQTILLGSRHHRLFRFRHDNYRNPPPPHQARHRRLPSYRAAPRRVRPSHRARQLSRPAPPSLRVRMRCQQS